MSRNQIRGALLAAALLVPALAQAQPTEPKTWDTNKAPLVIAHRSAELEGVPENSRAWIERAIALGIDAVHINPQITADGGYVLMHDNTLNRMTDVEQVFPDGAPGGPTRAQRGGKDYVRDYATEDILRLRLLPGAGEDPQPVTRLAEALETGNGRILLLLGLKSYEIDSLAAVLGRFDTGNLRLHELVYPGSDQGKLRDLAARTGIGVAASLYQSRDLLPDLDRVAAQLGPSLDMVLVRASRLTPEFKARARELGVAVVASGWDGPEDRALVAEDDAAPWRAILDQGYSAMTDHPVEVLAIRDR